LKAGAGGLDNTSGPLAIQEAGGMPQPPRREAREKELRELRDAYAQYGMYVVISFSLSQTL
jgi:hypothetical protein